VTTTRDGGRLGGLVRKARARAGLSQEELARRSGLSVRALRDIEQDRVRQPHPASLARLVRALGVGPAERDRLLAAGGRRALAGEQARPMVAIDVLGELRLVRDGTEVAVRGALPRAVLALTALRAGRPVARDEIVEALWRDDPPASWASQVHAAVSRVRALLTPDRERARTDLLSLEPGGYVLRVPPDAVDVHRFMARLRAARAAVDGAPPGGLQRATTLGRVLGTLDAALAAWRGPVLAGEPAAVRDHAVALSAAGARLEAAALLADVALGLGRPEVAIGHLRPLIAIEPYHEGLHARLVLALAANGEQAAALGVCTTIRGRLVGELGVEPGLELRRAQAQVLRGEQPKRLGDAAGRDRGDRWMVPRQLPADLPDFTGRAAELERLAGWLGGGTGARPVAAVAGMGGVGKSALVVRLAHRLATAHPDGQLYVNLRGADAVPVRPADVLGRFLRATGVDGPAIPQDAAAREDLYRTRTAGRRLLVVLDNAASAAQVRALLPGGRDCSVLVTSRTRLPALDGARWVDLDVLPTAESVALLGRVAGAARVAESRAAASRIAELCGNLPLAVRIAGARLAGRPGWAPERLAGLLNHEHRRLDQLAVEDLAVRASMDLSYRELGAAGRRAFRLLGLLDAPDVPADVAAAALGVPVSEAAESLDELVDSNLLGETGPDETGRLRYRFHDLLRLYARERAAEEDGADLSAAAVRRGLAAWLARAEVFARDVPGPFYAPLPGGSGRSQIEADDADDGPGTDAMAWFDAEQVALRAGIRQACREGLDELAFRLAGSLEKYSDVRGMYEEWRATGEQVMRLCRERGNLLGEAVMLRGLIDVRTWNTAVHDGTAMGRSLADSQRLVRMFEQLGEERGLSDAEVDCAWGYCAAGDHGTALACAERALARAEAAGHVGGRARAHIALALVKSFTPARAEAFAHLDQALTASRELGNPRCEASVLQFLGIAHGQAGNAEAGEDHLQRSLALSRRYGDRYTEVLSLLSLARLHLAMDDTRATAEAELSLSLGRRFTMPHHVADALLVLGQLSLAAGERQRAIELLEESVAVWRTRGWPRYLADALMACGAAHRAAGGTEAATRCWTEAGG
jgi:DNA-binding SARP family transcriptional activator/tetratricopeptide (TPR) repeat protein/DNA-binding XRE family transcriptional regulator